MEETSQGQELQESLKPTEPVKSESKKRTGLILLSVVLVLLLGAAAAANKISNHKKSVAQEAAYQAANGESAQHNNQQGVPGAPPQNGPDVQHMAEVDASLPSCSNAAIFSQLPIAKDHIQAISPLGNINPDGHVTPSDHIGIGLTEVPGQTVDHSTGANPVTIAADVSAPADLAIYKIHAQTITMNGGKPNADYSIFYKPCKEATYYFNHIPVMSEAIMGQIAAAKGTAQCQSQKENEATLDEFCDYTLNYKVKAGTVIGTAGGPGETATGIDFGGYDLRTKPLAYLDTNASKSVRADEILHSVCPIEYYPKDLQDYMYSVIGRSDQKRTAQPLCGEIMLDKAGTLQGNWYVQGSKLDTWQTNFSMAQDTVNPAIGIVSIGGTIGQPAEFSYTKQTSGTVNLDPAKATAGTMYCYSSDLVVSQTASRYRVLFQLASDGASMQVEEQPGTCSGTLAFTKATTYTRIAD